MSTFTIVILAGLGISFIFSIIVLSALAVSSRASRMEGYVEDLYEYEGEGYNVNNSWVTES